MILHGSEFKTRTKTVSYLCWALCLIIGSAPGSVFCGDAERAESVLITIEKAWPTNVVHASDGCVIGLTVPFRFMSQETLNSISTLPDLRQLYLYATSDSLSAAGIAQLRSLNHLTNLTIACARVVPDGVIDELTKLKSLQSLTLSNTGMSSRQFLALTNIVSLQELTIVGSGEFGDKELQSLGTLPDLTTLTLRMTAVMDDWLEGVRHFPAIREVQRLRGSEADRWIRAAP